MTLTYSQKIGDPNPKIIQVPTREASEKKVMYYNLGDSPPMTFLIELQTMHGSVIHKIDKEHPCNW